MSRAPQGASANGTFVMPLGGGSYERPWFDALFHFWEGHAMSLEILQAGIRSERLYTSLDEAVAELHRRRADKALCCAVEENRRHHPPTFLKCDPVAVLWRNVITPGFEFMRFKALAQQSGLRPLCLEYRSDKFVSKNPDKHMLGVMRFRLLGSARRLRIVDFSTIEKLALDEVRCKNGLSLVDFHHQLLERACPGTVPVDISSWFREASRQELYYLNYLSLFITSGILFENFFLDDAEERRFADERLFPSLARVVEIYGVKPLIVRLFTAEEESEPWLWQYPGELYPVAKELLYGPSRQVRPRDARPPQRNKIVEEAYEPGYR